MTYDGSTPTIEARTFACRNGDCYACPSTSDEWNTCACDCHSARPEDTK